MAGEGAETSTPQELDGQPLPEVVARTGPTAPAQKFTEAEYAQYRKWRRAYDEHSRYKRRVTKWLEEEQNYIIAESSGWLDLAESESRCEAEIIGDSVKIHCALCSFFETGPGKKFDITQTRSMSSRYDRERRARR